MLGILLLILGFKRKALLPLSSVAFALCIQDHFSLILGVCGISASVVLLCFKNYPLHVTSEMNVILKKNDTNVVLLGVWYGEKLKNGIILKNQIIAYENKIVTELENARTFVKEWQKCNPKPEKPLISNIDPSDFDNSSEFWKNIAEICNKNANLLIDYDKNIIKWNSELHNVISTAWNSLNLAKTKISLNEVLANEFKECFPISVFTEHKLFLHETKVS